MSTTIYPAQPEQILKGLGKLWANMAYEETGEKKPSVLRACAMTLIVATDESDSGYSASQTISELMQQHPSRGIVLAVSPEAEKGIQARVLAQCWRPFGRDEQICCEQIEILVRPESWPDIGPTLIGLIAPDLPVVLWCRHGAALSMSATRQQVAGLEALMRLATKIVVDTHGEDLRTSMQLLSEWRKMGRRIADLQWARLTPWRQPIAQIFDNTARENKLSDFGEIEIAYTSEQPSARVFYAAGWLSAPHNAKVTLTKTDGYGRGIHRITLRSPNETIDFERTGNECMTLRSTNGRQRRYTFAEPETHVLMNEELSLIGHDPVFDTAFARAQELMREHC